MEAKRGNSEQVKDKNSPTSVLCHKVQFYVEIHKLEKPQAKESHLEHH